MENQENFEKKEILESQEKEKLLVPIILGFVFAILTSIALFQASGKEVDLLIGKQAFDSVKNQMVLIDDKDSLENEQHWRK